MNKSAFFVFLALLVASFFLGRITSSPEVREIERIREVKVPNPKATETISCLSSQLKEARESLDKIREEMLSRPATTSPNLPNENPELALLLNKINDLTRLNQQLGKQLEALLSLHSEDMVTRFAQGHEFPPEFVPSVREMVNASFRAGIHPTMEQIGKIVAAIQELEPQITSLDTTIPPHLQGRAKNSSYSEELSNWRFSRRTELRHQLDDRVAEALGLNTAALFPEGQ